MIGRILRIVFFIALIGLAMNRLFSRKQKRALREVVQISAWVFLVTAVLALGWYLFSIY
ncbi:protein MIGRI [Neisseria animaloris]|uniref:protein MIGRI n=1 Tax=Neisseria animaloris TaxID=326522 RepID=UPI0039E1A360